MNKKKVLKEIRSYVFLLLIVMVSVFLMNRYVYANAEVPTGSMEPLVMPNDRLIINRMSYLNDSPGRGDVIMFYAPKELRTEEVKYYLKRVIGLPGEKIEIRDGLVYVNGSKIPLEEDYLKDEPNGDYGPFLVPKDSYFMLGDNRDGSSDSRFWETKYIPKEDIIGKAFLRYFPGFMLFP